MSEYLMSRGFASKALVTIMLIVIVSAISVTAMKSTAESTEPVTNAAERARYLYLAGLSPECMCVSGIEHTGVSVVVSRATTEIERIGTELRAAESNLMATQRQLQSLQRVIRSGTATDEQKASLSTVTAAASLAESSWDSLLTQIYAAGVEDLASEVRESVEIVNANADWKLPHPYARVARTEREWVALRNALAAERIATKRGEELDRDFETLLLQVRAEAATAEALNWAATRDDAIQTAFAEALD